MRIAVSPDRAPRRPGRGVPRRALSAGGRIQSPQRRFRVLQPPEPAAVAAGFDQLARLGEVGLGGGLGVRGRAAGGKAEQAGAMQTDVRQMQPHRPPLGDLKGLVEILACAVEIAGDGAVEGAGEEATGEVILYPRAAQYVDGGVDVLGGRRVAAQHAGVEGGAGEGEVVEADGY
jgi:hypothetical protein